jgi:hypothetical protein
MTGVTRNQIKFDEGQNLKRTHTWLYSVTSSEVNESSEEKET